MKYALTGSTGLLGTALAKQSEPTEIFAGDVCDFDQISRWIQSFKDVQAIIHLAALVPKQIVDMEPRKAFETNAGGTLNILEVLRRLKGLGQKTPRLFYASTSHVYAPSSTPIDESSPRDPFTLYGLTKLQGEQWCEAYVRDFDLDVCTGRIFSFSDAQQPDFYFIPAMFRKIRQAPEGSVVSIPGVQGYRDFLRVPQICEAILGLSSAGCTGPVNIGTGQAHKLSDLVLKIAGKLGRSDLTFDFIDGPADALVSDTARLKSLGISLECQIDELIGEMAAS